MVLYLSTILIAMVIIFVLNVVFGAGDFANYEIWMACAITLSVVVEIAISGIFSTITERIPRKCYHLDKKFYQVSKREQRFYEKLGIKYWKDKVWELGALGGFRKNKVKDPNDVAYLDRFIIEIARGMIGHIINLFAGFLVIFILPLHYWWRIGLPVAIVGFLLNLLPTFILRYNLPKLQIVHKRAVRLASRADEESSK